MSNLSTAAVVANEIVKAVDFSYTNDQTIANIAVALRSIMTGEDIDYIIGGKILPYPSGGMNFLIDPIYGHCRTSGVDIMDTVRTPQPISVESAHSTLDRIDTVQVRGVPTPADFQQRKFKDPETGAITTDTIATKKNITLETMVKRGADGSVTAPLADAGWIKLAELRIPAGTTSLTDNNICNITARVAGTENSAWTLEKTRTFNPGYISDIIAKFIQAHNDDGSHKPNTIKAANIKFGIETGDVNGGAIPIGTSINILGTNYTSQVTLSAIIEALISAINMAYPSANDALNRFVYTADLPVAASTANVNITTGGEMVIDGITCTVGRMVFLKNQTDKRQNGYWEVQTGAWNRYAGYTNTNPGCFNGKFILIKAGTANAGKIFYLSRDVAEIGNVDLEFKESIFSPQNLPGKAIIRDETGRADIDRFIEELIAAAIRNLEELIATATSGLLSSAHLDSHSDEIETGRNLLTVLGVNTIPEAMAEIRRRCNNNGEIDDTRVPDFRGLMAGDYIDGLDFTGITPPSSAAAPTGGPQPWNDTYKNNRIVIAGFNTYKQSGDTENAANHILFVFRNVLFKMRQRPTNDNTGGYAYNNVANEIRDYLEGLTGDGSGIFATKLEQCLDGGAVPPGGKYLYTIRKCHSIKGNYAWNNYTVFPPSEIEVFGYQTYGDEANQYNLNVQFPIYQKSTVYRCKKHNGARAWHWESTPQASVATNFALVGSVGNASTLTASNTDGGVAPAFCVR